MALGKNLKVAAGNAGGEAIYVDDVFSTYLYTGTGSSLDINNGVDLESNGGMVWTKDRLNGSSAFNGHRLSDSERNNYSDISYTNESGGSDTVSSYITPLTDGFNLGTYNGGNYSGREYTSYTFRKAENFFDIVTWTGNGVAGRTISHNLGGTVGAIWVKATSDSGPWTIWHRGLSNTATNYMYDFGTAADEQSETTIWNSTAPTDTEITLGTNYRVNSNGVEYVAYIFAHHDGTGTFGADADQDIIKCGVYQGLSSGSEINLGFEPQWLMIKRRDGGSSYAFGMWDIMRGFVNSENDALLEPGKYFAESSSFSIGHPTATGFVIDAGSSDWITSSGEYIYIAIRRPHKPAETGSEVFDVNETSSNQFVTTGFPVDLQLGQYTGGGATYVVDRMRGMSTSTTGTQQYLQTQSTGAEAGGSGSIGFNGFVQDGFSHTLGSYPQALWSFKRSTGFFDVVCYTGDGTAGQNVSHNLTVAPELVIVKRRDTAYNWAVYNQDIGNTDYLMVNTSGPAYSNSTFWNDTSPTESVFTVGTYGGVNASGGDYIAYLFASQDGISKVGSYTGNGSTQNIDCGFTSGARFVLIKRTDSTGDWHIWDTARGIVAGNDLTLYLNQTYSENNGHDTIDPDSSGFIVNQSGFNDNVSGATYVFLAIS
jgi:hypothetical protein